MTPEKGTSACNARQLDYIAKHVAFRLCRFLTNWQGTAMKKHSLSQWRVSYKTNRQRTLATALIAWRMTLKLVVMANVQIRFVIRLAIDESTAAATQNAQRKTFISSAVFSSRQVCFDRCCMQLTDITYIVRYALSCVCVWVLRRIQLLSKNEALDLYWFMS